MKKLLFLTIVLFVAVSCKEIKKKNSNFSGAVCELVEFPDNNKNFPIDDNTAFSFSVLFPYVDKSGKEYLTFMSGRNNSILFYDFHTCDYLFDIKFNLEGPNGVGRMTGYYIENLDNIFITSFQKNGIIKTDTGGYIKQFIQYGKTTNGFDVVPSFVSYPDNPLFVIDKKIYITQKPFGMIKLSDSPVSVIIDTTTKIIDEHLFKYPPLIKDEERNNIISALSFGRDFDGKNFVYSFSLDENIYITNNKTNEIRKISAKSKYINNIRKLLMPDNPETAYRMILENSFYRQILYDKYRNVYYRFTHIGTETDKYKQYSADNIWRSGALRFSIIILDENFNIIGETLFPEGMYTTRIAFVHKNGLYISDSYILNPDFDENILSFKCFTLKKQ